MGQRRRFKLRPVGELAASVAIARYPHVERARMAQVENGAAAVAIIGAGPAGLATAASLQRRNVSFELWDRSGVAGGSFSHMPRGMRLLSPRRYVHLPYHPYAGTEEYPSIPQYEGYLHHYASRFGLSPLGAELVRLTRTPGGFHLEARSGRTLDCHFVVVATGMFGNPVWPDIEGLRAAPSSGPPRVLHAHDVTDAGEFSGRRLLIVGAGISGVGIAEEAAVAGARVMISRRADRTHIVSPRLLGVDILHWVRPFERLPRALFARFCERGGHAPAFDNGYRALVARGRIEELPEVTRIDGGTVYLADGTTRTADVIVAATGYRFATPFLDADVCRPAGRPPVVDANEATRCPGLFFVGAPCARHVDSAYLRGIASDAPRVAESIRRRLHARRH